ncbi:MAG: putative phosphoglycerate mutase family protein [Rhodospirillaceae bacterium]|nr:MAG: putative phosphoglycerate mutase family protein [Rhodospirillaceae bacterium]
MPARIHLIRHGQSTFNAAVAVSPFTDPMLFDPPLSARGWAEVAELRGRMDPVELVLTSPLTRAVQTALSVFGDSGVPMVVEPLLREGVDSRGDIGSRPSVLAAAFPTLDFSHLDDPWWFCDPAVPRVLRIEPEARIRARVAALRNRLAGLLAGLSARSVAVIGHGGFFNHMIGERLGNCAVVTGTWGTGPFA